MPPDRIIDGRDIWPLLAANRATPAACAPHDALYFYWGTRAARDSQRANGSCICRIRINRSNAPAATARPGAYVRKEIELSLFDLEADPGETTNVAERHPDVVKQLQAIAERARDDLGDSLTGRTGKNVRPAGKVGP